MPDTKYLIRRHDTYYFNYRIPESLKSELKVSGAFFRQSLKTGSLKEAQRLRTAKLAELHKLEDEVNSRNSGSSRFEKLLTELRIDRDSAPDEFDILNPDDTKKSNDSVYVDAYKVASNELIQIKRVQDSVELRKKQYGLNLSQVYSLYMNDHPKLKETSVNQYKQALNFLPKRMHSTPVEQLNRNDIKDLIKNTTLMQNTVKARIRYLKLIVTYACDEDKLSGKNPFENLNVSSLMKNGAPKGKLPLPTDIHGIILKETESRRDWQFALPRLLPLTGLRISEMLSLTPEDIKDGMIHIKQGKTANAIRQIPISKEVQAILDEITPVDGKLIPHASPRSVQTTLMRNKEKWGWAGGEYGTHSFRKMFATALQEVGCPEADANFMMGHRSPTLSYGLYSVNPDVIKRIKPSVDKVINAPMMKALKTELSK
ncbi:tyrosine-type recombinase/integrase [Vibrio cortegadensis]|uniref:tyrosine-type recombinase/integrase n=1 Tax=Vibrio cortegadensis TaxID=1328770 RepID=UPI0021C27057|nr:tyrosine-type recombinase/integrase [Vibrio cortegadensis]MDN3696393.1 tyrosine-type recombinase/integrase [Vibrio cortegadensis]